MIRVIVENSTWNNIGDGFYQTSLYMILKTLLPQEQVAMGDGPIARAFRPSRMFTRNAFDIRGDQAADLYCFSGPILGERFMTHYAPLIEHISGRGATYMLLSAHGSPDLAIHDEIKSFLRKYPPIAFSSRTRQTYDKYRDAVDEPYNGICAAFFVSLVCPVASLDAEHDFVIYSFYSRYEPRVSFSTEESGAIDLNSVQVSDSTVPFWRFSRHFEWLRRLPSCSGSFQIVRPVHEVSYKFSHLNFAKPNSFLSYNPLSYLSLYSGGALTVSDRVHACVAALSYGKPAALVGKWDRATLFDRLQLRKNGVCYLAPGRAQLKDEYEQFTYWLGRRLEQFLRSRRKMDA